jgi:AraC-like DNA-binding protein
MTQFYKEERQPRGNIRSVYDCSVQRMFGRATVALPHIHEYFEILYCQAGSYQLTLGGAPYRLDPGDMAIIAPMEVHGTRALDEALNQYLVIKFMPEVLYSSEQLLLELRYLLPHIRGSASHQKVFTAAETGPAVGGILREIVDEFLGGDFGYEIALRAGISRLFLWLLRAWHRSEQDALPDEASLTALNAALEYVDENYAQDIRMADAARRAGMAYTAFSRLFKSHLKRGFSEYLLLTRLKKAAVLLAETELPVTRVAMDTGFSTASYFIQRFREYQGTTPRRFRSRFRQPL